MSLLLRYFTLIMVTAIVPLAADADHVLVSNAWVNEAPPVARVNAGYLVISNNSNREITLLKVESPEYARVEIHQSQLVDGQMKMTAHPELVIGPNEDFHLSPGGFHLMLFKPLQPVRAGAKIELMLYFDQETSFSIEAMVRKHAP